MAQHLENYLKKKRNSYFKMNLKAEDFLFHTSGLRMCPINLQGKHYTLTRTTRLKTTTEKVEGSRMISDQLL